jgi:hypothetical protein
MKTVTLIILTMALTNYSLVTAQEGVSDALNAKIGVTFSSFGDNYVYRSNELVGVSSYDSDYFYSFGINYVQPLNKWLETETGIEYTIHSLIINPNVPPDKDSTPYSVSFGLINLPVTLRANFLNYFFVNGGIIIDIDASLKSPISSQTGIGTIFGIALKHDFKNGISAFINPYTKMHSLLPLMANSSHQRIWENGYRFGITYKVAIKRVKK